MTAMRAASAYDERVMRDFAHDGRHVFPNPLDPAAASALLAEIRRDRAFDSSLFLTEQAFDADPQHIGVNPRPGRNLIDRFEQRLGFVERNPQVTAGLTTLLGEGYSILNRKVVCGVPESAVPAWLRARIKGNPVNNLGAYVRAEYRDITYFYGIDFHQDLIDYKARPADFVTLYVYLHPVGAADAPLFLLEGSHDLGATIFPHDLTPDGAGHWRYTDRRGGEARVRQSLLTGPAGYAAMWHACTLHGTQPDAADNERISLRYLFARGPAARAGIDEINAGLRGPVMLDATREDLAADGSARIRANTVNRASHA
jgi:hypothetical protein